MGKANEIKKSYRYTVLEKSKQFILDKSYIYDVLKENFNRIDEITEKPLKLAILGEFSAGKSTFINRLIGMDILPTGVIPITSVVTVLEYGKEEKVEIIYQSHDGSQVTKQYEGYSKLFDFQKSKQEDNDLLEVKEIRVFIKNDILKTFHIIDTPGFNDSENMSEATEKIFDSVNYIIWLFNATQTGKGTEKELLKRLQKNALYKDNMYAVVNYGDVVVTTHSEYDDIRNSLLKDDEFETLFVNKSPLLISSLKQDEFWNQKFDLLKNNLSEMVLKKDKHISELQLQEESKKLKKKFELLITSSEKVLTNLDKEYNFFNESYNENIENSINLRKQLLEIIRNSIEDIEEKLKNSTIYERKLSIPLLKFSSFYATAENLEKMQIAIEDQYKNYIEEFSEIVDNFKLKIISVREQNKLNDNSFEISIDKRIDAISSNLEVLKSNKKLLIIGYIIGVLSDDYIYNLLEKKMYAVESLSEDTIDNLLKMDLDMSYFTNEIKSIMNDLAEKIKENIELLKITKNKMES